MAVGIECCARQVVMRVAIAAHHVIGGGTHGGELGIARQRRIGGLDQIDQAQRLGGEMIGQIEARQDQPGMIGVGAFQTRHRLGEAPFGGQERAARHGAPGGEIQIGSAITDAGQRRRRL